MKNLITKLLIIVSFPILGQAQLITSKNNSAYYIYNNSKDTLFLTKINQLPMGALVWNKERLKVCYFSDESIEILKDKFIKD